MGISAFVVAAYGVSEQTKAAKQQSAATGRQVEAQKQQQRSQKKLADIKATRERRRLAREARVARAQVNVATQGEGGSRAAGVSGSIATQAASARGFLGQQEITRGSIFGQGLLASSASADIASAQARGQIGGAIGSLATTGYSIFK